MVAIEIGFEVWLIQKSDLVSLNRTEINYSVTELECLPVVWVVKNGESIWKAIPSQ